VSKQPSRPRRAFASDNNAGVHPEIIEALKAVNEGHVTAYGSDEVTARAIKLLKKHFGKDVAVYFVFGGTGANVLGLSAITKPYQAIFCAQTAHINTDECGAAEKFTGCKLLSLPTPDGKLRIEQIEPLLHVLGNEHHSQPRIISISQATEMGTIYTKQEIKALAKFAHDNNMLLHVDGARLANAAASLDTSLKAITADVGVDLLSFGGTKNGMMYGEAVVFFDERMAPDFKYIRKQGMHLPSKMRYVSAQFEALLSGDLWRRSASHANRMARLLASELEKVPLIKLTQPVEANGVFAVVPPQFIPTLKKKYFFYTWNEAISEVRLMASFDTTEEDIQDFIALVRRIVK
jgi:threonine aldolase